jgi:hypothetical protein
MPRPARVHALLFLGLMVGCDLTSTAKSTDTPAEVEETGAGGEGGGDGATGTDGGEDGGTDEGTGETGETKETGGPDTGEEPTVGLLPWPTVGDGTVVIGAIPCSDNSMPCNHAVRIVVRGEGGSWTSVTGYIAEGASVPQITAVDYGEGPSGPRLGLWLTWVDVRPDNLPEGEENTLTTGFILLEGEELSDAGLTVSALADRSRWVFLATDAYALGERVVDPDRILIEDGAGGFRHYLVAEDMGPPGPSSTRSMVFAQSVDGVHFEWLGVVEFDRIVTDPDCSPVDWSGEFPASLPAEFGPDGSGRWRCFVSDGGGLQLYEGGLWGWTYGGNIPMAPRVSATVQHEGEVWIYGHEFDFSDGLSRAKAIRAPLVDGVIGANEMVLGPRDLPATSGGVFAPSLVHTGGGVEILSFHTQIESPVAPH